MLRFGRRFELKQELMDNIATYMDDDIREDLHCKLAPCEPELFLQEYIKRDPKFERLLWEEFGIEMEE
jgi:hypothetical protein